MPDVSLAARHNGFADFSLKQVDVRDSRPARAGDEDAVCLSCLFVEALSNFVSGVLVHVRQVGVFSYAIALNFQYLKTRCFEKYFHSFVERILVRRSEEHT